MAILHTGTNPSGIGLRWSSKSLWAPLGLRASVLPVTGIGYPVFALFRYSLSWRLPSCWFGSRTPRRLRYWSRAVVACNHPNEKPLIWIYSRCSPSTIYILFMSINKLWFWSLRFAVCWEILVRWYSMRYVMREKNPISGRLSRWIFGREGRKGF